MAAAMQAAVVGTHVGTGSCVDGPASTLNSSEPTVSAVSSFRGTQFSSETTLEDLRAELQAFADEREWAPFHTPRNVLLALVGEIGGTKRNRTVPLVLRTAPLPCC